MAATHVLRIQKALDQMNLQIHYVISDITGLTGLKIVDSILQGERDPKKLAPLRDGVVAVARIGEPVNKTGIEVNGGRSSAENP